jgi:hypothetical protein
MNTRTHIDTPALPLLRRASTLIAMGTVGLALVAAAPAGAQDTTTTTTTITKPSLLKKISDTAQGITQNLK